MKLLYIPQYRNAPTQCCHIFRTLKWSPSSAILSRLNVKSVAFVAAAFCTTCHIFDFSYITLHYGWLSSRTVGKYTVHTQKLYFSALRNMFKTTESYRWPLNPTAVVYQQPPYRLHNTPLYRAVTEIHHGYRVAMVLCQLRTEAEETVCWRVRSVAKSVC